MIFDFLDIVSSISYGLKVFNFSKSTKKKRVFKLKRFCNNNSKNCIFLLLRSFGFM